MSTSSNKILKTQSVPEHFLTRDKEDNIPNTQVWQGILINKTVSPPCKQQKENGIFQTTRDCRVSVTTHGSTLYIWGNKCV